MRYVGGKNRQKAAIVSSIARLHPNFKVHVEPFAGALWSGSEMMRTFPDREFVFNDANPAIAHLWLAALEGWDPPDDITEAEYAQIKARNDPTDPLTAYAACQASFGGFWFASHSHRPVSNTTTVRKIKALRAARKVTITCTDYQKVKIPKGASVYLDPPYPGRTVQWKGNVFTVEPYYEWAKKIAQTAGLVVASQFSNPNGWEVLHDWGQTIARPEGQGVKPDDPHEILMKVTPR